MTNEPVELYIIVAGFVVILPLAVIWWLESRHERKKRNHQSHRRSWRDHK